MNDLNFDDETGGNIEEQGDPLHLFDNPDGDDQDDNEENFPDDGEPDTGSVDEPDLFV